MAITACEAIKQLRDLHGELEQNVTLAEKPGNADGISTVYLRTFVTRMGQVFGAVDESLPAAYRR